MWNHTIKIQLSFSLLELKTYFGAFTLSLSSNNKTEKYPHVYKMKHKSDSLIRSSILPSLDTTLLWTATKPKKKKRFKTE